MEGLLEAELLVVEVVAHLVHERAQERAERDDLLALRRAHPHADARGQAPFLGLVEAVQFAVVVGRALRQHAHADRRHVIARGQRVDDALSRAFDSGAIVGCEGRAHRGHVGSR